jgi:catechol 2,3-dioxygenase-like lactoylglutathione lyase family enzyme
VNPDEENPTMFSELTPNLMVPDVNAAVAFYRDVLGCDFVLGVPGNPPGSQEVVTQFDAARPLAFAVVQRGKVQMMFQSQESFLEEMPPARDKPLGATASLYIELPDAAEFYRQIQGRVKCVKQLHRTFYGTEEFYIEDPNGYILGFASRLQEDTPR